MAVILFQANKEVQLPQNTELEKQGCPYSLNKYYQVHTKCQFLGNRDLAMNRKKSSLTKKKENPYSYKAIISVVGCRPEIKYEVHLTV